MAAFKDKNNNTWKAVFYYTDYQGNKKQKFKRGFKTKKEALEWEREFLLKAEFSITMAFQSLYDLYMEDLKYRIRENTYNTKNYIIKIKILPFFEKLSLEKITPIVVRKWQNDLLSSINKNGEPYSQTYIKTINNQLVAIFNYAVKYHGLKVNPCHLAGSIGKKNADEMNIWNIEDFNKFVILLKHKPISYTGFYILFWTGLRIGELLALTFNDINLDKKTISINKSYQRISGKDVITLPKTPKSKRILDIPDSLNSIIKNYVDMLYKPKKNERLFPVTKHLFSNDMILYSKKANIKKIRIHDLRHSHTSFLFNNGVDALSIAKRLGHEKVQTTLDIYTHLYKETDDKVLEILNVFS